MKIRPALGAATLMALALGAGPPARADVSETWTLAPMGAQVQDHTSTLLADGRVMIVGGTRSAYYPELGGWRDDPVADVRFFDPQTEEWSAGPSMHVARGFAAATVLGDGRVLVTGGLSDACCPIYEASAEIFDPATDTWTMVAPANTVHMAHTASLLTDGRVLVVGMGPGGPTGAPETYDPATDTWSWAPWPRASWVYHDAVTLTDGRVLLVGGCRNAERPSELFDPATATWTTITMNDEHCGGRGALLADGRVLVAGAAPGDPDIAAAEIFDPATMTWTSVAPLTYGRHNHIMVTLDEDRVVVAGGGGETPYTWASAEVYRISTDTWTELPSMQMRRISAAATQLADGRVLVSGGYDSGWDNSELLDMREPTELTAQSFTGNSATFVARLTTLEGEPIDAREIAFVIENNVRCTAVTDADGFARCRPGGVELVATLLALRRQGEFIATFGGDGRFIDVLDVGRLV